MSESSSTNSKKVSGFKCMMSHFLFQISFARCQLSHFTNAKRHSHRHSPANSPTMYSTMVCEGQEIFLLCKAMIPHFWAKVANSPLFFNHIYVQNLFVLENFYQGTEQVGHKIHRLILYIDWPYRRNRSRVYSGKSLHVKNKKYLSLFVCLGQ